MTYYVFKCPVTSSTSLICNLSKLTNQTIQGYITPIASTDSNGNPNSVDNEQFLIPSNFYNQPYLLSISQLTCISSQYIIPVFLNSLKISWIPNTTYTFQVNDSFVLDNFNQGSPLTTITYTTNPTPSILASDPVPGDSATANNDNITLDFQRHVFGTTGSFYLFQIGPTAPTLIRQYHADTEIRYSHGKIILDTRNVLLPGTTYYLLADPNCLQDYDGFVWSGLPNTTAFRFTTAGEPTFRDLIVYEVSSSIVSALIGVIRSSAIGHFVTSSTIIPNAVKRSNFSTPVRLNSVSTIHPTIGKLQKTTSSLSSHATQITLGGKLLYTILNLSSNSTITTLAIKLRQLIGTLSSQSTITASASKAIYASANLTTSSSINVTAIKTQRITMFSVSNVNIFAIKTVVPSVNISSTTTIFARQVIMAYQGPEMIINNPKLLVGPSGTDTGFRVGVMDSQYIVAPAQYEYLSSTPYTYGIVYIFNTETCQLDSVLYNPMTTNGYFGVEVAMNNSYIAVSSDGANNEVFIYDRSSKSLLTTINGIAPTNQLFIGGKNMILTDNNILITQNSRTIYMYNPATGTQISSISIPSDNTDNNSYVGWPTSINYYGDYLVVGDYTFNKTIGSNYYQGRVQLYQISTGQLLWSFINPETLGSNTGQEVYVSFGNYVEIDDIFVYISDTIRDSSGNERGIIYQVRIDGYDLSNPNIIVTDPTTNNLISASSFGFTLKVINTHRGPIQISSGGTPILQSEKMLITWGATNTAGTVGQYYVYRLNSASPIGQTTTPYPSQTVFSALTNQDLIPSYSYQGQPWISTVESSLTPGTTWLIEGGTNSLNSLDKIFVYRINPVNDNQTNYTWQNY